MEQVKQVPAFPIGGLEFLYTGGEPEFQPVRNFCYLSDGSFHEMQRGFRLWDLRYQGTLRVCDGEELTVAAASERFEQAYAAARPQVVGDQPVTTGTLLLSNGKHSTHAPADGRRFQAEELRELLDADRLEMQYLRGEFEEYIMVLDEDGRDARPVNPVGSAVWKASYPPEHFEPYFFQHGSVLIVHHSLL